MLALAAALLASTQAEPIKIGALFSTTGSFASVDVPGLEGFKLAAVKINARGGVLGRQIEVVAPDFQSDPSKAGEITKRLISQGVVAMGGFYDTDYALPAGKVAEKMRIPMVTSGATLPTLPTTIGQYFFMACYGDDDQARAGAWFTLKGLDAKTTVLLKDVDATYTKNLGNYFALAYSGLGGKLSQIIDFNSEESVQSVIRKIRVKPEAFYVSVLPEDAGPFTKALRAAGYKQPIISGDGFDTPDLVKDAGKAANNVFYTTHYAPNAKDARTLGFKRTYHDLFGTWPDSAASALAYDTMNLIADAIDRAGSVEPGKIRYALATTKEFPGVTGTITYAPGKRKPKKSIFVLRVHEGKEELVKTVSP
ncbi:MAG: ABC transporter substrate-binding protein [Fimbriimonas sp.]